MLDSEDSKIYHKDSRIQDFHYIRYMHRETSFYLLKSNGNKNMKNTSVIPMLYYLYIIFIFRVMINTILSY